jgi:hypothetical protein
MKRWLAGTASVAVVLGSASAALAEDLRVPADFPNLQDALVAAAPGDRILLERGTHRGPFVATADDIEIVGSPRARIVRRQGRLGSGLATLTILGDRVRVRGVRFSGADLHLLGEDGSAEECTFGGRLSLAGPVPLRLEGRGGIAAGNLVDRTCRAFIGIVAWGEGSAIVDNVVDGARVRWEAVAVNGDGTTVAGNDLRGGGDGPSLSVLADGAVVEDNLLEGGGLRLRGDGNGIAGNLVEGSPLGSASLDVAGDGNLLRENACLDGADTGVLLAGRDNVLSGNEVRGNGTVVDGVGYGHGFVVVGPGNVVVDSTVEDCVAEGFSLSGNVVSEWVDHGTWWEWVERAGDGIVLDGCTATGAGSCGLGNWTEGTEVTDSAFLGNGVDVVDGFGFEVFDGNDWISGGPGWTGTIPGAPSLFGVVLEPTGFGGWD